MTQLPRRAREKATRFLGKLQKDDDIARLFRLLNQSGEAFLFGGAVRDVILGVPSQVVDLDIVVAGSIDPNLIEGSFGGLSRTKLGGYRLKLKRYEVDFWELEKSKTLHSYPRIEITIGRLLKNVCFSTDAVAVGTLRKKVLADYAFAKACEDRVLDFVVDPGQIEPKVVARIARLVTKHNLEMSARVASYFVRGVEGFGNDGILGAEESWGEFRVLNPIRLESLRVDLQRAIEKAFRACAIPSGPSVAKGVVMGSFASSSRWAKHT